MSEVIQIMLYCQSIHRAKRLDVGYIQLVLV